MRKFNFKKAIATISAALTLCSTAAMTPVASFAANGNDICTIAQNDVGKSRTQVGCGSYGDWCAMYATKTAEKAGIVLNYCNYKTYCTELVNNFLDKGIYHSRKTQQYTTSQSRTTVTNGRLSKAYDINYIPKPGDFILYDWDATSSTYSTEPQPDHIGIVEYVSNGVVHTIEGNRGGSSTVDRKTCDLTNKLIHGYVSFGGTTAIPNETPVNYTVSLAKGTAIYKDAGSSTVNQYLSAAGTYTITKEKTVNNVKYGYLKSGAGWVKLSSSSSTPVNTGEISVNYTKYLAKGTAIYKDAGSSTVNQYLSAAGTFTITKEKTVNNVKYGYLKSGAGWVKL